MKYRKLSLEELEELREDFVRFLAANHVTAPDWEKIKTREPEKAEGLIALFSDEVFEQVLTRLEYLEFKTPQDLKTFHCGPDKIVMLGLLADESSGIDFTQNQPLSVFLDSGASLKLYTAEKGYGGSREQELFRMMENGCLISKDGEMFRLLDGLRNGMTVSPRPDH